jgi:LmeA-like phospholipid-binding
VTHPQGAPHLDPSTWARPGSLSSVTEPVVPGEPPTSEMPPAHAELRADHTHEPPAWPAEPNISPTAQHYSAAAPDGQPPSEGTTASASTRRSFLRDPLSTILILVIAVALLGTGLIGAELYARKRAADVVAAATECEVKDKVQVSFGPSPFLLQHATGNYTDISIHTAGNQIRDGKGMKADITVNDVTLHDNGKSKGTIGAVDATIVWTSNAIKETVQDGLPFVSGLIDSVRTNPGAGTIQLSGALGLGTVTLKPRIADGQLSLEAVKVTAMGALVPHETAQAALDVFTSKMMKDYPLGIRADNVQVTNDGVVGNFSAHNALIPANECFAHI